MLEKRVIPSDVKAARRAAEEILVHVQACGYGEDVCFAIRLALEEALINAIKHGNRFDHAKHIVVSADVAPDRTAITVSDEGTGFTPGNVPDPTADENLEKPCGRGIMLMRHYMDEVEYNQQGNEVRMVKRKAVGK